MFDRIQGLGIHTSAVRSWSDVSSSLLCDTYSVSACAIGALPNVLIPTSRSQFFQNASASAYPSFAMSNSLLNR